MQTLAINESSFRKTIDAIDSGAIGGGSSVKLMSRFRFMQKSYYHPSYPRLNWQNLRAGCFLFCTREAFETAGRF